MAVIPVPKPKGIIDLNRPANALLLSQVSHLQHAERRLPLKYRTQIYTHAIRTEGEAAEYIQQITQAIHQAHLDMETLRKKKQRGGLTIAAAAAKPAKKKPAKSGSKKRGKKK